MAVIRVTPSGIMDKDTDLTYVNRGNYVDANDIRHRQTDGQNFAGVMSVKGNSLALTLPSYSTSTKTYRIFIDVTDIASGAVSANEGSLLLTTTAGTAYSNLTLNITGTALGAYITTLKSFFNTLSNSAYGGNFTYGTTITTGTYTAYFDLSTTLDTDFVLKVQNITSTLCTIRLKSEYNNQSGDFTIIGSTQLNNDLYVLLAGDDVQSDGKSYVSELGVITYSGSAYTYLRLLRTNVFTLNPNRNCEMQSEKIGTQINLYWTDGVNKPRVIYIDEDLKNTEDGCLFFTTNLITGTGVIGRYDYESLDSESSFFVPSLTAYLDNIVVNEGGGYVTAGNKRYTGRFLTRDLVPTDFLYPTNPLPIYDASISKPNKISGNTSGFKTSKAVSMSLENIPQGVYEFFDFAVIEYAGESWTAKIIQRVRLTETDTKLDLLHTELGQDNILLSAEELISLTSKYTLAQNMRLYDNRMVLSNLTEETDLNLSSWAEAIKHSIHEKYLPGVGLSKNPSNSEPGLAYGEYQDPLNVLNYTGYMFNDTYRFGIQVQWKTTKKWSLPYWVDDIRFDGSSTNVVGARRKSFGGTVTSVNTSTEVLTLANHGFFEKQPVIFSATTIGGVTINTIYYVYNVTTNTFTLSSTEDTNTVVNLTSLGTGTLAEKRPDTNLTDNTATRTKSYYVRFHEINLETIINGKKVRDLISSFRFVRAERIPEVLATGYFFYSQTVLHPTSYYTPEGMSGSYPVAAGRGIRDRMFFYSPDYYFGKSYNFAGTDKIKLLQPPDYSTRLALNGFANGSGAAGDYFEYSGYFGDPITNAFDFVDYSISSYAHLDLGTVTQIGGDYFATSAEISSTKTLNYSPAECFKLSSVPPLPTISANNRGFVYGQIYRDLGGNKKYFINKEQTRYNNIGDYKLLSNVDSGLINNYSIFGGDVFTQKSYTLLRLSSWASSPFGTLGAGWGLYSQNTSNTQLMTILDHDGTYTGPGNQYPQLLEVDNGGTYAAGSWGSGVLYWVTQWPEVSNQKEYERHYDITDLTITESGYDKNNKYVGALPARITWSNKKLTGSLKDSYRYFSPLDVADLDYTLGEIAHHDIINNNLYTWQENSLQRQYFRDSSYMNSSSGSDVVVGAGSILGSKGESISTIGCSKKYSIVKGKTPTGKETVYWFNDRLQKFMRFAQDGVSILSEKGMNSYFLNNTKLLIDEKYPLSGRGISGVWNDVYKEVIFTFKQTSGNFTLVYDESKNGFVAFHSYYPNSYFTFNNKIFTPRPSAQKTIWLHDSGSESTYYGTYVTPSLTAVMNYEPNISKNFEALQFVTDTQPFDVYLTTTNHVSYLDNTDFEKSEDLWYSPIKNDSTSTGLNSGNTSRLWGKWLKVKMTFEASSGKQKLINFIVKFRAMPSLYNQ